MNSNNNKFDIYQSINGDQVIGFTSVKDMKNLGWFDKTKVKTYLNGPGETTSKHLGMINLYASTHNVEMPMMKDLFENSAVLEVPHGQTITYDLPVNREVGKCLTMEDTSTLQDFPGIDGSPFLLILSHEYTPGDILTYDPQYGQQVMVSPEHTVEQNGDTFQHWVVLASNDNEESYDPSFLRSGVAYCKIGNALAEFDQQFSGLNMIRPSAGSITCEYILSSPRGVSTFYTSEAARQKSPGLNAITSDMMDRVQASTEQFTRGKDAMFIAPWRNGKIDEKNLMVGSALEYFVLMELAMMEAHSLQFAKAFTINTTNGVKRVNEGVWHSIRRGKIITYPKPNAITLDDIHEATAYIFRNSTIPVMKRRIKFRAGYFAYQNILRLFREYAVSQLQSLPPALIGYDKTTTDTVFAGSLDSLRMQAVAISSVVFPSIGTVEVVHDASLDYQPMADRLAAGYFGEGKAHNSHSLVIWDATDSNISNVLSGVEAVKGAKLIEGKDGSKNTTANIYYVKPEGPHVTYGYEQGRMNDGDNFENVLSSMKYMGREFWATSVSSALTIDTTRYVVIELERPLQSRA